MSAQHRRETLTTHSEIIKLKYIKKCIYISTEHGKLLYLPCSWRSPLFVVEKWSGTRRAATKMASPPNFHHHFHCYFGHSWSHFTAERSKLTFCCCCRCGSQTCVSIDTCCSRVKMRLGGRIISSPLLDGSLVTYWAAPPELLPLLPRIADTDRG